ncbi:unnamed protein product, partial [Ilex paraguariensis]
MAFLIFLDLWSGFIGVARCFLAGVAACDSSVQVAILLVLPLDLWCGFIGASLGVARYFLAGVAVCDSPAPLCCNVVVPASFCCSIASFCYSAPAAHLYDPT